MVESFEHELVVGEDVFVGLEIDCLCVLVEAVEVVGVEVVEVADH